MLKKIKDFFNKVSNKNLKNKKISRVLVSDAAKIKGKTTKLFIEYKDNSPSIREIKEQDIVKWIFENEERKRIIIEEIYGEENIETVIKLEVKEPLLNKSEQKTIGDIDAVIIPIHNPEKTTVIEFKKVKLITLKNGISKPNKISAIKRKGFSQIKKLRKFNYSKTYLGIVIEDDARNVVSANTLLRSTKNKMIDNIFEENFIENLESKAGLLIINLIQPTGKNFRVRYNLEIFTSKIAKEVYQDKKTTEKILKLLEKENK